MSVCPVTGNGKERDHTGTRGTYRSDGYAHVLNCVRGVTVIYIFKLTKLYNLNKCGLFYVKYIPKKL